MKWMIPAICALLLGCAPHSIAAAVLKRHDEFPRNSYVLIPPSDLQRLGETVEDLGDRRARPQGNKCFDVVPVVGSGLNKIELSYKAGKEFKAEVGTLVAEGGGTLKDDDTATVVLDGLKVIEGVGIPNRNSACRFVDGVNKLRVITSVVVATSAKIEFARNITFNASGKGGWNAGTGSATGGAGANLGQSGKLFGTNIVITGAVNDVTVDLASKEQDLTATPIPGTVVTFPQGYDGRVRIDKLNTATPDQIPVLTVTPTTPLSATLQNVPANLRACEVDKPVDLKPGPGCFVWDRAGASGVNIWFEPRSVGGAQHVVLHLDGYSTKFIPEAIKKGRH